MRSLLISPGRHVLGKGFGKFVYQSINDIEAKFLKNLPILEFKNNQTLLLISVTLTIVLMDIALLVYCKLWVYVEIYYNSSKLKTWHVAGDRSIGF